MKANERIAQYALQLLGGEPEVNRYWNVSEDKNIDLLAFIGDDGSVWYTNNHYETFIRLE